MKIAIAGFGAEGHSNYDYYTRQGHQVVIVDERDVIDAPIDASIITGEDAFKKLKGFDVVVRTAGLAPHKIITDGKIWSATNEFFAKCPAPIIGVTGSKGKGTTCSLIVSILRAAGETVHLVGNIGVPALDVLDDIKEDDVVVYELSSFQLWDLEVSPQVAVILMIEPDHLDVHADFGEYVAAKSNIASHQTVGDMVVYNARNTSSKDAVGTTPGLRVAYPSVESAHVHDGSFYYGDVRLCSIDALKLPGVHNLDNACAAIDAAWRWVQDGEIIGRGLSAFTGLPHRLKYVREVDGITYYDDSIATTPGSAIAALRAFSQPKVVILGGSSKGADFSELAEVAAESSLRKAMLIGAEAPRIEAAFNEAGVSVEVLGDSPSMTDIVKAARTQAKPGDIVILSPACASFGMFKNYSDRGDQFIAAVNDL
jgi:UDP-N-acetylmuramoylalanine--D-glutamate ligase